MNFLSSRMAVFCSSILGTVLLLGCANASPLSSAKSGNGTTANGLQVMTRQMPDGQDNSPYWAALAVQGGAPPYRWSVASGELPDGLALDAAQGVISGTAANIGQFPFSLRVDDSTSSARANLAIKVVSPAAEGLAGNACAGSGCYGPGIGADGLANTTVGPNGDMVSYRFRAQQTGEVEQFRMYLIPDRDGYAAGTGGKLQITINTDDGTAAHNPSNTKLASYLMTDPLAATPSRYFPLITFAAPPTLVAGQLYHIVFSNADSSPSVNFLSVDALYLQVPTAPVQPRLSDVDAAVLLRSGNGNWNPRKGYTPIMELRYSDGSSTGIGYMEGWVGAQQTISGGSAARETFTVSGPARTVGIVGIRAARVLGTDNLRVRLENDDGSLIEEGQIPATAFPLNTSPAHRWATYSFSSPHTLTPGRKYHLTLETAPSSTYQVFPVRKGAAYGFGEATFFRDGSAELNNGDGWVGWTQWGVSNRTDSDLQFYFGATP